MNALVRNLRSPAMIVACISLVVALGGVSYAAGLLPKNSVGPSQLQKKAVTAAKIKRNAVTGAKVKDGSLKQSDFGTGELPAGPRGPEGDQGQPGTPGTARAYGRIAADGTVSRSRNVTGVTRPYPNVYCIHMAAGIVASQTGLVATPDWTDGRTEFQTNGDQSIVEWRSDAPNCPAGTLEVYTGVRQVITTGSPDGDVRSVKNGYTPVPFFFIVP